MNTIQPTQAPSLDPFGSVSEPQEEARSAVAPQEPPLRTSPEPHALSPEPIRPEQLIARVAVLLDEQAERARQSRRDGEKLQLQAQQRQLARTRDAADLSLHGALLDSLGGVARGAGGFIQGCDESVKIWGGLGEAAHGGLSFSGAFPGAASKEAQADAEGYKQLAERVGLDVGRQDDAAKQADRWRDKATEHLSAIARALAQARLTAARG